MKLHIFVKDDCPQCPAAKKLGEEVEKLGKPVCYHNVDTPHGMAQALKYMVRSLPVVLLTDSSGKEQQRWLYPELPVAADVADLI